MKMKYKISAEQYAEIKAAQKRNRDKQIENRLKVLALRYEGKSLGEIADATGFHHAHISNLIRKYFEEGLSAVSEKHYAGNRRNMSIKEEAAFLEQYRQSGEAGQILEVREMKIAYEEMRLTLLKKEALWKFMPAVHTLYYQVRQLIKSKIQL